LAGGSVGGATAGSSEADGVNAKDWLHAGQATVCPVPSDGYSIGWPQCGHSLFKNSPMREFSSSLKNHAPNSNPAFFSGLCPPTSPGSTAVPAAAIPPDTNVLDFARGLNVHALRVRTSALRKKKAPSSRTTPG
jgi:hypothetical protein